MDKKKAKVLDFPIPSKEVHVGQLTHYEAHPTGDTRIELLWQPDLTPNTEVVIDIPKTLTLAQFHQFLHFLGQHIELKDEYTDNT